MNGLAIGELQYCSEEICMCCCDSAGSERRRGPVPVLLRARHSAGKECPQKAGSKPPSNWALTYRERERRRGGGHSFISS